MSTQKGQWGLVLVLAVTCGFWWEATGPIFAQSEQARRGDNQGFQVRGQAGSAPPWISYGD